MPSQVSIFMPSQMSIFDLLERPSLDALLKPDQIYETDDYTLFTRLTEDDRYDRKSSRQPASGLAVYLSAFGNGPSVNGGVIAVGITNDRRVEGCKHLGETVLQEIELCGDRRCPTGRFRSRRIPAVNYKGEEDFLILIRIEYVEDRLVELTDGTAYVRKGHECKLLKEHEKQGLRIDKGERAFELEPCGLTYPDEFRTNEISRFVRMVRERRSASEEISTEQVLEVVHLGRRRDGVFIANNACALLFARDSQQVFPGAYVHFLRYGGTEEGSGKGYNVTKDRLISGTVLDIISGAAAIIDANTREFTQFRDGKFYSVAEYPRDAWYELLVNACVHRSYHIRNAPIFIKMFDDHIAVESPGGFMPQVTPANIYDMHRPRNPFMMLVLREFGEVRCINEGTKRIRKEMVDAKLPEPEFAQETHGGTTVRAILRNDIGNRTNSLDSEAYKVLGEVVSLSLDLEDRKIINYIIEKGKINVSEALRILKTTYWHTAKGKLTRLCKRGILDFVSSKSRDPAAHYVMRKQGNVRQDAR